MGLKETLEAFSRSIQETLEGSLHAVIRRYVRRAHPDHSWSAPLWRGNEGLLALGDLNLLDFGESPTPCKNACLTGSLLARGELGKMLQSPIAEIG